MKMENSEVGESVKMENSEDGESVKMEILLE